MSKAAMAVPCCLPDAGRVAAVIMIEIDGRLGRFRQDAVARLSQCQPPGNTQAMDGPPVGEQGLFQNDITLPGQPCDGVKCQIVADQLGARETQGGRRRDPAPLDT